MRNLVIRSLALSAAAFAVLGAGTSYADSVANTAAATSVTKTSAMLHGTINAGSADVGWTFQYGTSQTYGHNTAVVAAGPGMTAVSQTITGLSPGTTYHFRLAAVEQVDTTLGPSFFTGADMTFTTLSATTPGGNNPGSGKTHKFGKSKLAHRRLKVKGGFVSIPFTCVGAKGLPCKGKVSLSATKKIGNTRHTFKCGAGKFATSGGHGKTVRAKVPSKCLALLKASRKHSISATLKASFSTHQGALKQSVTLFE
ncbi:MAG: fibronectin type III domain-containing protein [Actinomycetota bacterium]|nr:fibronectin type III domain-containing protein [Actinomycetota bacterium]